MSVDCEVTREDQTLINRFARLNAKCEELESDLELKKRQLDNTREAIDELCIQDDQVLVHSGEVFAKMSNESANEWCDQLKDQLDSIVKEIEEEVKTMRDEMTTIKTRLYAKFGQNINLESDE